MGAESTSNETREKDNDKENETHLIIRVEVVGGSDRLVYYSDNTSD